LAFWLSVLVAITALLLAVLVYFVPEMTTLIYLTGFAFFLLIGLNIVVASGRAFAKSEDSCLSKGIETNQQNVQVILEDLPVALIRLTDKGVVEGINGAARALLGRSNLIGKSFSDEVEGLGRSMRARVEESVKGGGIRTTEMGRFIRNGKEDFPSGFDYGDGFP